MRTPRLPVVDWTDAPADLNGLVRFAERRNLVSALVPSQFKRSLPPGIIRYSKNRALYGLQGRSRWVRKISPPTRIRSPDRRAGMRYPCSFWELHGGDKHIVGAKCRVIWRWVQQPLRVRGSTNFMMQRHVLDRLGFLGLSKALPARTKNFHLCIHRTLTTLTPSSSKN